MQNIEYWQDLLPSKMRERTGSNGRKILLRKENSWLFNILNSLGCFRFYSTNNGDIIGTSQVIAFLYYGYKALANGFTVAEGCVEVHHKDGNIINNHPNNLVYLSKQDHIIVSNCTNTPAIGRPLSIDPTPFNSQGKEVKNAEHFLSNIIQATLNLVAKARSKKPVIISLVEIVKGIPKMLYKNTIAKFMPRWMNRDIQLALFTPDPNLRFN